MQVNVEDISAVKKRLRVEVPSDTVASSIETAYRDLAKTARVKGFRPNKVPRAVLERYYKDHVEGQVATDLIDRTYPEAVAQAKLDPIAPPTIEEFDLKPGQDFTFSALVEVRPEVDIEGYEGLELERQNIPVTDDMIEAQIEALLDEHSQMEDVEEPLEEGMWASADFQAFLNGQPVKALTSMGELIRLTEEAEASELEKAIRGMQVGEEREVTLHLPANYHVPSLRDQDVTFKIKVHAVKRKVLPPLDEELAHELKFESVAAIREKIHQELEAKIKASSMRRLREDVITKLIAKTDFEVPEAMVDREVEQMVDSFKQRIAPRRVDMEEVNVDKLRENFRKPAERRARAELILGRISDKEGFSITEEDVENGIKELAADVGEEPERIRQFHEQANLMESLKRHLREEKAMDFLIERAKLKETAPAAAGEQGS